MAMRVVPMHSNFTEKNHLGKALLIKPELFEGKMTQLFTSMKYSDNPLTAMLAGKSEKTIGTSEWEWKMKGATAKPLTIVENVEPNNSTPGKGKRTFKIKLDKPWWLAGDVIHPGASDKSLQVRIQENPIPHGKGYVYTVKGMWDDPNKFMPLKYLTTNQLWNKLYSQYEEGAEQSGSTQYAAPFMMTGRLSRFRKKYRVTGDAATEVLQVKMEDSKGGVHDSWIKYAEVEYWEQWYRELERGAWYSRKTDSVEGSTGRHIYSGPGVLEQLEDSHQHYYSVLTAKLIEEYLMDIFYSRIKPGSKGRSIKGFTGEYGMIAFHRAVQNLAEKRGFLQVVENTFMQKGSSEYHNNALTYGYQFTKYRMANGIELELIHNPLYDDREQSFDIDPLTGFPVDSQRITFLDFGGEGGDSNIKLVNKANSFRLGYVAGLQTPYGPANNTLMSHSGDYYEMHVQKECGVHIEDVSRCGELIFKPN